MSYHDFPRDLAPTIAQYLKYDDLLANSEQVPLNEFQQLSSEHMPRFADGLFDLPPGPGLRRKRKRLSDFSNEEKQARRKLKNRIAAQSARDRKRHEADQNMRNMEELESEVIRLREENKTLRVDNQTLRAENTDLRGENMALRQGKRFKDEVYYSSPPHSSYNSSPWQSPKLEVTTTQIHPTITPSRSPTFNAATASVQERKPSSSLKLVDPRTVEHSLRLASNNCVHSSNTQLLQVVGPADGLPMPQERNCRQSQASSRKVAIRAPKKTEMISRSSSKNGEEAKPIRGVTVLNTEEETTASFKQVQALYTLVMTILFQTAGTMISRHATQSQSSSRELNRRLRAVRDLRESKRQRLSSPIKFWETENLHQASPQAAKSTAPYHYQPLPSPDKSQTRPSSTKSSKSSQSRNEENLGTKSTPSSSTTSTRPTSWIGGKDRQRSKTSDEAAAMEVTCPLHARHTANCLACQCKGQVSGLEPAYLSKLNISDHLLRQATLQVQRKRATRALKRQNSESKEPCQQSQLGDVAH